ncbi:hypothetical protein HDV03_003540 [Kappamyces sp. JEL0829]|nr:hypothetical protein HDV03_003540 [Kappamyces sp. JEL0829]
MYPDPSVSFQQLKLEDPADASHASSSRASRRPPLKKRVTDGDLSVETRMLIKQMMKSSKLSFSQQRYLDGMVEETGLLPLQPVPIKPELYKAVKRAAVSAEKHIWFQKAPALRTLDKIKEAGLYDIDFFRTTPMRNMNDEKEKLQSRLEKQESSPSVLQSLERKHSSAADLVASPELDEIELLKEEIAERRQWMADMVTLGRGDSYKRQIHQEIRQRMSRIESLKRLRAKNSK